MLCLHVRLCVAMLLAAEFALRPELLGILLARPLSFNKDANIRHFVGYIWGWVFLLLGLTVSAESKDNSRAQWGS